MQTPDAPMDMAALRREIDSIDDELLRLIQRRANCAIAIGDIKRKIGAAFHVPERERGILERLRAQNAGSHFPDSGVRAVFREVMSACLQLESPLSVAYLGPGSTFSYQAVRKAFGEAALPSPEPSLDDVFDAVEMNRCEYAIVPIENSFDGTVTTSLQRLLRTNTCIHGELFLPISHCLASQENSLDRIKTVYSHPQALAQCRVWLRTHLGAEALVETPSTARACRDVQKRPGAAAIGTVAAALEAGLNILARNIQDRNDNETRFFVLARARTLSPRPTDKTSVIFSVPDKQGALVHVLSAFARHDINLRKLESVPCRDNSWKAHFWADIEGPAERDDVRQGLDAARAHCDKLHVIGSYPSLD